MSIALFLINLFLCVFVIKYQWCALIRTSFLQHWIHYIFNQNWCPEQFRILQNFEYRPIRSSSHVLSLLFNILFKSDSLLLVLPVYKERYS